MFNLAYNMMGYKLQCLFGEPDFPKCGLKASLFVNVPKASPTPSLVTYLWFPEYQ